MSAITGSVSSSSYQYFETGFEESTTEVSTSSSIDQEGSDTSTTIQEENDTATSTEVDSCQYEWTDLKNRLVKKKEDWEKRWELTRQIEQTDWRHAHNIIVPFFDEHMKYTGGVNYRRILIWVNICLKNPIKNSEEVILRKIYDFADKFLSKFRGREETSNIDISYEITQIISQPLFAVYKAFEGRQISFDLNDITTSDVEVYVKLPSLLPSLLPQVPNVVTLIVQDYIFTRIINMKPKTANSNQNT